MRKMKILSLILAVLLCLPCFASCHKAERIGAFEIPKEFDTSRDYEITFWAKNDTNMTQVNIYKQAIEDFEAIYPNIKVKIKFYTDYGRIYNDVITNISTGTTPNVCITYPDHIATYMTGEDVVVPLDDLLTDRRYGLGGSKIAFDAPTLKEMVPEFLEECKIEGIHYAVPYMRSTEACYINKDYVEALGYTIPEVLTWDFIFEVSAAAMEKDENGNFKVNGQKTLIPFIYKSTDNMMIQMLKQKGAEYSTANGDILIFNDDTKEILMSVADSVSIRAFDTFARVGYPGNFFNRGQCIFAIDSTAGATWMGTDAPSADTHDNSERVEFETIVKTVPQYDVENPQMISQGPSICIFNKEDSQEVLASWIFVQFMLTNSVQIAYAQTEGYVPVTLKAQNSDEYQDYLSREGEDNNFYYDIKLKATKLLIENTENTFVTPVFNGSMSLRNAAGELIESVTKAVRRNQKVNDEYFVKLFDEVSALYRLDQVIGMEGEKKELGPMPTTSIGLISVIGAAWLFIGVLYVRGRIKDKKQNKK